MKVTFWNNPLYRPVFWFGLVHREKVPNVVWREFGAVRLGAGGLLLVGIAAPVYMLYLGPGSWLRPYSAPLGVLVWQLAFVVLAVLLPRRISRRWLGAARAVEYRLCPECGGGLRGLPDAHVCPECGREYAIEEVVRVWREWAELTGWKG